MVARCWPLVALVAILAASANDDFDPYVTLGVDEMSTDKEIKVAYRKLSLKHHPDKGGDAAVFKQVSRAYEVLSDGEKRALFDAGGMEAVDKGGAPRVPSQWPTGRSF